MAMTINNNSTALTAQRNINAANMRTSNSLAKLSSGSRVPSAKDDVAALAVGTKLRAEVQSLQQAQQNVGQGIALLQIADGALDTLSDMLTRMKVLAVQSTSGQLGDAERTLVDQEYQALATEVDRIAADTAFNGTSLLAGSTTAVADVNNLGAQNLIGEGFASIELADNFGEGAIKLNYVAADNLLEATNMVTGAKQTIDIGSAAIGAGQNQQVAFNSLGVTVTLSDQFDKATDITAVNTAAAADGAEFTTGQIEAASINIDTIVINAPDPADPTVTLDIGAFDDASVEITGAAASTTLTLSGFYKDGSAATLTATAIDLSTVGTKTISLADANGNQVNISLNVTTGYAGTGATGSLNTVELLELGQTVGTNSVEGASTSFTFKVGTGTGAEDDLNVSIGAANFSSLAGTAVGNVATASTAAGELTKLLDAIDGVTSLRATVGAAQSRLEFAGSSIAVATENTLSAQSSMLDVDVSQEMTEFTSSQVLLQAGISMLAQANQQPELLLSLLQ